MPGPELLLGGIFGLVIVAFLVVDLGFFERRAHKTSLTSAINQSIFWVLISGVFGLLVYAYEGRELALQFFSAYLTEKMLSVDNLFVILLIFGYFKIEEQYHHRVLFWGILGAIVMRAVFIGAGAYLVGQFHWILYIFGAVLVFSGIKLLKEDGKQHDVGRSKLTRLAARYLPLTDAPHHGRFTHLENGKRLFTSLFMALVVIELTDLVFAVDSIPAAFAISDRPFIIYTANIFALMGLRAMFFLLENIMHRVHYLSKALACILIFVGGKMLADILGLHISSAVSFGVIILSLVTAVVASHLVPRKHA